MIQVIPEGRGLLMFHVTWVVFFFVYSSNQGIKLCCFNGFLECRGYRVVARGARAHGAQTPERFGRNATSTIGGSCDGRRFSKVARRSSPEQMFRVDRDFPSTLDLQKKGRG